MKAIIKKLEKFHSACSNPDDANLRDSVIKTCLYICFSQSIYEIVTTRNDLNVNMALNLLEDLSTSVSGFNKHYQQIISLLNQCKENSISVNEVLRSFHIKFTKDELISKYDGKDRQFIEDIFKEFEAYISKYNIA